MTITGKLLFALTICKFLTLPSAIAKDTCEAIKKSSEPWSVACNKNTAKGYYWQVTKKIDEYGYWGLIHNGVEPRCDSNNIGIQAETASWKAISDNAGFWPVYSDWCKTEANKPNQTLNPKCSTNRGRPIGCDSNHCGIYMATCAAQQIEGGQEMDVAQKTDVYPEANINRVSFEALSTKGIENIFSIPKTNIDVANIPIGFISISENKQLFNLIEDLNENGRCKNGLGIKLQMNHEEIADSAIKALGKSGDNFLKQLKDLGLTTDFSEKIEVFFREHISGLRCEENYYSSRNQNARKAGGIVEGSIITSTSFKNILSNHFPLLNSFSEFTNTKTLSVVELKLFRYKNLAFIDFARTVQLIPELLPVEFDALQRGIEAKYGKTKGEDPMSLRGKRGYLRMRPLDKTYCSADKLENPYVKFDKNHEYLFNFSLNCGFSNVGFKFIREAMAVEAPAFIKQYYKEAILKKETSSDFEVSF